MKPEKFFPSEQTQLIRDGRRPIVGDYVKVKFYNIKAKVVNYHKGCDAYVLEGIAGIYFPSQLEIQLP